MVLFLFYVEVFGEEVGGGGLDGLVLVVLVVVGAEVDSLGGNLLMVMVRSSLFRCS